MVMTFVSQSSMSYALPKAFLDIRPYLGNLSIIELQNALIGPCLIELVVCSPMLIYSIAEIFGQRLFSQLAT